MALDEHPETTPWLPAASAAPRTDTPIDPREPDLDVESDASLCEQEEDDPFRLHPLQTGYERYQERRPIGAGGVGYVSSVFDPNLGRHVAMKELHATLQGKCHQRARFFREARVTAQLQHPNIVPVHELGTSAQGGVYFTMKKIRGITMQTVLTALKDDDADFQEDYPLTKRLEIFIMVCQAVAFAHSRGVIHRDLKPANILLGSYGEVLVTDWGLVKVLGKDAAPRPDRDPNETVTVPPDGVEAAQVTMDGAISGTPLYMSPEQAMGQIGLLDQRSDIYSLGAILYELLTFEKSVEGTELQDVMMRVVEGQIVPPKQRTPHRRIPCDLSAICMKCLRQRQNDRYPSVEALLADLRRYQQGLPVSVRPYSQTEKLWKLCRRHPVISSTATAVTLVCLLALGAIAGMRWHRTYNLIRLADRYRQDGVALHEQMMAAQTSLHQLDDANVMQEPTPAQVALRDRLDRLSREAENAFRTAVILYVSTHDARRNRRVIDAMSEIFTRRIDFALAARDYADASQWLSLLATWLGPDYKGAGEVVQARVLDLEERVRGDGSLTIASNPPGANVVLQHLGESADHGAPTTLGTTPIAPMNMAKGRYLLIVTLPDRSPVHLPVRIGHGEAVNLTVRLPRQIPDGTVYVAGGPFLCGGPHARHLRLHERSLDSFFIKTHEVTFGEYLAFWQEVAKDGKRPELMSRVQFDPADRNYHDAWDADGHLIAPLTPELPVVGLPRAAAVAYCTWLSRRLGRPVRLPTAEEWEKAARGIDGRAFPWGDDYDPAYAFILDNQPARERWPLFAPPGSFPRDVSVYGAWDLGGNVREWTGTPFPDNSPFYQIKGASAATTKRFLYCSYASDTPVVPTDVGFRYVLPYIPELDD